MKLPKRAPSHIAESDSLRILRNSLPNEWVIRDIGERDYGVDLYVEIVKIDKYLRGDLVFIQLKGHKEVKFKKNGLKHERIKRSTLNYWLGHQVPIFLVSVCLKTKNAYWANIKEQNRTGNFKGESNVVSISLRRDGVFSKIGLEIFLFYYEREKAWAEIEVAIENALMSFNSFGPLVLICRRQDDDTACSTTIQYLLNKHIENYYYLNKFLFLKSNKNLLPYWYKKNLEYSIANGLTPSFTFYFKIAKEMLDSFLNEYRNYIIKIYNLVTKEQRHYFSIKFNYLLLHLDTRPHTFLDDDWFPRFYFDEYERDTENPYELYFKDFDEFDDQLGTFPQS